MKNLLIASLLVFNLSLNASDSDKLQDELSLEDVSFEEDYFGTDSKGVEVVVVEESSPSVTQELAGKFLMRHTGLITFYLKYITKKQESFGDSKLNALDEARLFANVLADVVSENTKATKDYWVETYAKHKGLTKSLNTQSTWKDEAKVCGATLAEVFSADNIKSHFHDNKNAYIDFGVIPLTAIAGYKLVKSQVMA